MHGSNVQSLVKNGSQTPLDSKVFILLHIMQYLHTCMYIYIQQWPMMYSNNAVCSAMHRSCSEEKAAVHLLSHFQTVQRERVAKSLCWLV